MHTPPRIPSRAALAIAVIAASSYSVTAANFAFGPPLVSPLPEGHTPTAIRLADLSGDGKLDAVVSGRNWNGEPDGTGRVSILKGDGAGQFAPWREILVEAGQTEDAAIADVNGDAVLDILISVSSQRGRLAVALGQPGGTFASPTYLDLERQPRGISPADLDGDGDLDVAAINYGSASLQVLRNDLSSGAGFSVQDTKRLGRYVGGLPGPLFAFAVDSDGDGRRDVLTTMLGGGRLSFLKGTQEGLRGAVDWKPADIAGETPAVIGASIADFDGDGDLDVALPALFVSQSQKMLFFRNGGDATFAEQSVFDVNMYFYTWSSAPIDVDGDGRLDVAIGTALSGAVWFMRNETASPEAPIQFTSQPILIPYGVFVRDLVGADVDGDGDQDIVGIDIASSTVFVAMNQTPQGGVASDGRPRPPNRVKPGTPQPLPIAADLTHDGSITAADVAVWLESSSLSGKGATR